MFWEVFSGLEPEHQRSVLKFATSCSRPPLQGFNHLQPPFCIHQAAGPDASGHHRLPTASTCLNLLKLPPYTEPGMMRDKLMYAIGSGSGFDLS